MCGRYSLSSPLAELVETFDVSSVVLEGYRPRYNIAPTQEAPVLVRDQQAGLRLGTLRWGLVPFWAQGPEAAARLINARGESAHRRPAFREAFRRRRCLVPSDGFYEWHRVRSHGVPPVNRRGRQPFWIHAVDRRPMAFAGLWEWWRPPGGGAPLGSFTILTAPANGTVRRLHDRMPVVLPRAAWARWLDPGSEADELRSLLAPAPPDLLEAWPVSTLVNAPSFDEPACIEEVREGAPSDMGSGSSPPSP